MPIVSSSTAVHDLDTPWPGFLDYIDREPRKALEGLHVFAWKLFETRPPSILRGLDRSDRQDRIADLVYSCARDGFRKLRTYRNAGRPFSGWLTTVLVNQVLDGLRSRRPSEELTESLGGPDEDPPVILSNWLQERLKRCFDRMSERCQLYLACLADGLRPREIAELLQLPPSDNKSISDDLRYCLRRLREMLLQEGVNPEEVS